jgi:hypothetical protein
MGGTSKVVISSCGKDGYRGCGVGARSCLSGVGIVIGADNITVELKAHALASTSPPLPLR